MKNVLKFFSRSARSEQGITGLETAIILIAFVVVATIFAFVVLTTGVFSSERGKETVFAGLEKARGTMEVRGGVVVTSTGTTLAVDDIQFAVATTAGGEPLDPAGGGQTDERRSRTKKGSVDSSKSQSRLAGIQLSGTGRIQPSQR